MVFLFNDGKYGKFCRLLILLIVQLGEGHLFSITCIVSRNQITLQITLQTQYCIALLMVLKNLGSPSVFEVTEELKMLMWLVLSFRTGGSIGEVLSVVAVFITRELNVYGQKSTEWYLSFTETSLFSWKRMVFLIQPINRIYLPSIMFICHPYRLLWMNLSTSGITMVYEL